MCLGVRRRHPVVMPQVMAGAHFCALWCGSTHFCGVALFVFAPCSAAESHFHALRYGGVPFLCPVAQHPFFKSCSHSTIASERVCMHTHMHWPACPHITPFGGLIYTLSMVFVIIIVLKKLCCYFSPFCKTESCKLARALCATVDSV